MSSRHLALRLVALLAFISAPACSSADGAGPSSASVEGERVGTVRVRLVSDAIPLYETRSRISGAWRSELFWVDGIELAPSSVTVTKCGGDGTHDDPSYADKSVEPGSSVEYTWGEQTGGAAQWGHDAAKNCERVSYVVPGPYRVHACLLERAPANPNGSLKDVPRRCGESTVEVPASGEALVTIHL